MEFIVHTTPHVRSNLADQLAQAMDLRIEALSRRKTPKLWKVTDKLQENQSEALLARRKRRNRVLGIIFLLVGAFLAVAGFAARTGVNSLTIGGVIAIIVAITYLSPQQQGPSRRMMTMGQKLVEMRRKVPECRIRITKDGMSLNGGKPVEFSRIETIVETRDLYLLIVENGGMFLVKDEFLEGTPEEFSEFLSRRLKEKFLQAV